MLWVGFLSKVPNIVVLASAPHLTTERGTYIVSSIVVECKIVGRRCFSTLFVVLVWASSPAYSLSVKLSTWN